MDDWGQNDEVVTIPKPTTTADWGANDEVVKSPRKTSGGEIYGQGVSKLSPYPVTNVRSIPSDRDFQALGIPSPNQAGDPFSNFLNQPLVQGIKSNFAKVQAAKGPVPNAPPDMTGPQAFQSVMNPAQPPNFGPQMPGQIPGVKGTPFVLNPQEYSPENHVANFQQAASQSDVEGMKKAAKGLIKQQQGLSEQHTLLGSRALGQAGAGIASVRDWLRVNDAIARGASGVTHTPEQVEWAEYVKSLPKDQQMALIARLQETMPHGGSTIPGTDPIKAMEEARANQGASFPERVGYGASGLFSDIASDPVQLAAMLAGPVGAAGRASKGAELMGEAALTAAQLDKLRMLQGAKSLAKNIGGGAFNAYIAAQTLGGLPEAIQSGQLPEYLPNLAFGGLAGLGLYSDVRGIPHAIGDIKGGASGEAQAAEAATAQRKAAEAQAWKQFWERQKVKESSGEQPSPLDIKLLYRGYGKQFHPDVIGSEYPDLVEPLTDLFKQVSDAYNNGQIRPSDTSKVRSTILDARAKAETLIKSQPAKPTETPPVAEPVVPPQPAPLTQGETNPSTEPTEPIMGGQAPSYLDLLNRDPRDGAIKVGTAGQGAYVTIRRQGAGGHDNFNDRLDVPLTAEENSFINEQANKEVPASKFMESPELANLRSRIANLQDTHRRLTVGDTVTGMQNGNPIEGIYKGTDTLAGRTVHLVETPSGLRTIDDIRVVPGAEPVVPPQPAPLTQGETNAVPVEGPASEVSRVGEAGQNIPQGGQGVRPGNQGQIQIPAGTGQEETPSVSRRAAAAAKTANIASEPTPPIPTDEQVHNMLLQADALMKEYNKAVGPELKAGASPSETISRRHKMAQNQPLKDEADQLKTQADFFAKQILEAEKPQKAAKVAKPKATAPVETAPVVPEPVTPTAPEPQSAEATPEPEPIKRTEEPFKEGDRFVLQDGSRGQIGEWNPGSDSVRLHWSDGAVATWSKSGFMKENPKKVIKTGIVEGTQLGTATRPQEVTTPEAETPAPGLKEGADKLIQAVYEKLKAGESLGNVSVLNNMAEKAFGASRVSGVWTPKDAFDAMEAGVNKYLLEHGKTLLSVPAENALRALRELMTRITSQGTRTEEQIKNQQFSTPPTQSYVAARIANIKPTDVVLEPSAGNGGLAVWPKSIGAEVHVNEISPRRREMMESAGIGGGAPSSVSGQILSQGYRGGVLPNKTKISGVDAEYIHANLDPSIKPTVVLMNPPFSASTQKSHEAKNRNQYGFNHVDQALQRLEPNGRLVAILGGGQANEPNGGASLTGGISGEWFKRIGLRYNVRANVRIDGKEYQKYGTNFATRIIVIDKDGPTNWDSVVKGNFTTLEEAYNALRDVENSRPVGEASAVSVEGDKPSSGLVADNGPSTTSSGGRPGQITGDRGEVQPSNRPVGPSGEHGGSRPGVGDQPVSGEQPDLQLGGRGTQEQTSSSVGGSSKNGDVERQTPITSEDEVNLEATNRKSEAEKEDTSAYVEYRPSVKGVKHPANIVETKTMSTVPLPPITYKPSLHPSVISEGKLSDVQLEPVALAGQQNEIILPGGYRASLLVGDGTGVGKGRIGAGILLDNWNKGRKRLVFVTQNWDLMKDLERDLTGLGATDLVKTLKQFRSYAPTADIDHKGILYSSYGTIRSGDKKGNTRAAQLARYLRGDDEGEGAYIVFDESHNLKNAVPRKGTEASQIGTAVKKLMENLPNLRSTSMSATAASDVMNLGYLDRLGLWGPGTPFPNGFQEFAAQISGGGMSAMEMIARELKAQGKYIARTLSYKGVEYSEIEHQVTDEQKELYRTATKAWKSIQQRVEQTIQETTNGGKGQRNNFMSLFYSAQQRFYNILLTTLKIPTLVEHANKALADGKSVVVTLINTNEAAQNREKNKFKGQGEEDNEEIPDYDFGPGEMLMDLVREHYPTQQWMDDVDENGKPIKVPMVDAQGNPVQNPQAVKERDALLAELKANLHMPANPLDMFIDAMGGHKNVAEMTGRKERYDPVSGQFISRGDPGVPKDAINKTEEGAFQSGKKRIALLSGAAGTGISLHASNQALNQQQRYHITWQVGWSADKAMQMLGRSHRADQAIAPEYALLKTNMGGETRFISTIARRLGSLEALGKGQTNTNEATEMMSKVNFETAQGEMASNAFYNRLLNNQAIPGTDLRGMEVLEDMGVLKEDKETRQKTVPKNDRTNVTRLLNRLLSLDPDVQNAVYDYYFDIFSAVVKQAMEDGTLDTGVKTLPGDSFTVKSEKAIATDPKTGAQTFHYPVDAEVRTNRISPEALVKKMRDQKSFNPRIMRNEKGKLFLVADASPIVHADGRAVPAVYVASPANGQWRKVEEHTIYQYKEVGEHGIQQVKDLEAKLTGRRDSQKHYEDLASKQSNSYYQDTADRYKHEADQIEKQLEEAKASVHDTSTFEKAAKLPEWKQQYEEAPATKTSEHHLIGGSVLRYWNPIKEASGGENSRLNIYTAIDSGTGKRVVGIDIPREAINRLVERISGEKGLVSSRQIIDDVLKNSMTYQLEGGIRIKPGRVAGKKVVEFVPTNQDTANNLKRMGIVYEKGMMPVYYLPEVNYMNSERVHEILDNVLAEYPPSDNSGISLSRKIVKLSSDHWQNRVDALEDVLEDAGEDWLHSLNYINGRFEPAPDFANNVTVKQLAEAYNQRNQAYVREDQSARNAVAKSPGTLKGPLTEEDLDRVMKRIQSFQYGTGTGGPLTANDAAHAALSEALRIGFDKGFLDSQQIDTYEDLTNHNVKNGPALLRQVQSLLRDAGIGGAEKLGITPSISRTTSTGIPLESESRQPQRMIAKVASNGKIYLTPEGKRALLFTLGTDQFKGATTGGPTLARLQANIADIINDPNSSEAAKTEYRQVLQAIKLAQSRSKTEPIPFVVAKPGQSLSEIKQVGREELVHAATQGQMTDPAASELLRHPLANQVTKELLRQGYPRDPIVIADEQFVKMVTGDHKNLGLSEDQADELLNHIFTVMDKHYDNVPEMIEHATSRARSKYRETTETTQGRTGEGAANLRTSEQPSRTSETSNALGAGGTERQSSLRSVEGGGAGGSIEGPEGDVRGGGPSLSRENLTDEERADLIEHASSIYDEGFTSKEDFAREIISDSGEWIKPHIDDLYEKVKADILTAPRNEVTEKERTERGQEPKVEKQPYRSIGEMFATGRDLVDKGERGEPGGIDPRAFAKAISDNPRGLSGEETSALNYDRGRLKLDHEEMQNRIIEAEHSGDTEKAEVLKLRRAAIEASLTINDEALQKSGLEWHLTGMGRQQELARDFSVARMVTRANAIKKEQGTTLSDAERGRIEALSAKIASHEKRISELETRNREMAENEIRQAAKAERQSQRTGEKDRILKERSRIERNLSSKLAKLGSAPDPSVVPDLIALARNYVKGGVNTFDGVVDGVWDSVKEHAERLGWTKPELKQSLANGIRNPKSVRVIDPEIALEKAKLRDTQRSANEMLDRMAESKGQRNIRIGTEIANVPRAIMESGNLHATLRQGLWLTVSNPKAGVNSIAKSFASLFSEQKAQTADALARFGPNEGLYEASGLHLADKGISQREEAFMSPIAEKIPGLGRVVRASGRAYSVGLNILRTSVFDQGVEALKVAGMTIENNPKAYHDLARFVNVASGWGSLGPAEGVAPLLNTIFYSPRFAMSRVQLMAGVASGFRGYDPVVRKMALKSLAKNVAFGLALLGLAKLAGFEVGTDPDSSDFGKIVIGKTHIDVSAGIGPYFRATAKIASRSYQQYALEKKPDYGGKTATDLAIDFITTKFSPPLSLGFDVVRGKDMAGRTVTGPKQIPQQFQDLGTQVASGNYGGAGKTVLESTLGERLSPIALREVWENMQEHGPVGGTMLSVPAFFGAGELTYEPRQGKHQGPPTGKQMKAQILKDAGIETGASIRKKILHGAGVH